MKLNVLLIPEKRGRKGHPSISIHSMPNPDGYIIMGFSEGFFCKEETANQSEGIQEVLRQIFKYLKENS